MLRSAHRRFALTPPGSGSLDASDLRGGLVVPGDVLAGTWGSFGALVTNRLICRDPVQSSAFNSACFTAGGDAYGWLQGTSMSTPNVVGVPAHLDQTHPIGFADACGAGLVDAAAAVG
jgi:subtilisin family serine protease